MAHPRGEAGKEEVACSPTRAKRRGLAGAIALAVLALLPAGAHGRLFGEAAGTLRRDGALSRPPVQARGAAGGSPPAFQLVSSLRPQPQWFLQGTSAPLRPPASRHPARISLAPPARRSVTAAPLLPLPAAPASQMRPDSVLRCRAYVITACCHAHILALMAAASANLKITPTCCSGGSVLLRGRGPSSLLTGSVCAWVSFVRLMLRVQGEQAAPAEHDRPADSSVVEVDHNPAEGAADV